LSLIVWIGRQRMRRSTARKERADRRRGEKKSDRLDARKLGEWLRLGTLKPVYHGRPQGHALRELARSYRTLVSDATRVIAAPMPIQQRSGYLTLNTGDGRRREHVTRH
jgi:hypothetical protein